MNVVGHIAVAQGLSSDPRVHLGAALPDLATFGRYRLTRPSEHPDIAEGVRLHHRTDDAFHASEWFRSRQGRLRLLLEHELGFSRGQARAIAHVGPEMMIDGVLLRSSAMGATVRSAFGQLIVEENRLGELVDEDGWPTHLIEVERRGLPDDYDDPRAVAARLERVLRRRPRLRFEIDRIEDATSALMTEVAGISVSTNDLITELVELVEKSAAS